MFRITPVINPVYRPAPLPVAPGPRQEPAGHPSWFRQTIAQERRPFWSWTGNVNLYAGPTFPDAFDTPARALAHAQERSATGDGAVAVLQDQGRFYLARLHNYERADTLGLGLQHSSIQDATRGFRNLNPALVGIVDHDVTVPGPAWVE